jgi:hypothetical protein
MLSPRLGRNSTATQFGRTPFHFNRIIMNNMFLNAKEWDLVPTNSSTSFNDGGLG